MSLHAVTGEIKDNSRCDKCERQNISVVRLITGDKDKELWICDRCVWAIDKDMAGELSRRTAAYACFPW